MNLNQTTVESLEESNMTPTPEYDVTAFSNPVGSGNLATKPPVNYLSSIFGGDLNQMLNKIYEYTKQLHEDSFPDHPDHVEAP